MVAFILLLSALFGRFRLSDNCFPTQSQNPTNIGINSLDPVPVLTEAPPAVTNSLSKLISQLGGTAALDPINPVLGNPPDPYNPIETPEQLYCDSWNVLLKPLCRWHNEKNGPAGDELEWARGIGRWDGNNGITIFGTETSAIDPWLITGASERVDGETSAMLISDVVKCQEGDGELTFLYWTSPGASVRVCTREPGAAKIFDYCSPKIRGGDPGPAVVSIPGSILDPFEIVIQASDFDFDDFGRQGGAVIIDDVQYKARKVQNCKGRERSSQKSRERSEKDSRKDSREDSRKSSKEKSRDPDDSRDSRDGGSFETDDILACEAVKCNFDDGVCLQDLTRDWTVQRGPIGNRHTGIRSDLQGPYGVAQGPAKARILRTRPFRLSSDKVLEFCYYRASANAKLAVRTITERGDAAELFRTTPIDKRNPHSWVCEHAEIRRGSYDTIEFISEDLRNRYAYFGLDEVNLLDGTDQFARPIC